MKRHFMACTSPLAFLAAAAGAASAQDAIDPASVTGKITYYTHWTNYIDDGSFDQWEADFKALYPSVEDVEVLGIADYAGQITTRLATGDYGDVLETSDQVPADELADFFLPITDLDLAKDWYYADRWASDGEVYGLTFGVNVEGIVYNKQAFADAGVDTVPTRLSELKAAYEKLKANGAYPIVVNLADGWPSFVWTGLAAAISGDAEFGNKLAEDPAPFDADKPYGQAMRIFKDLIDSGLTEDDLSTGHWQDSKSWLASGKGGSWFLGNWSINQIVAEGAVTAGIENYDATNLGYFPFPYDESGGPYNVNSGPDWAMVVNKDTQNPDLAKAWLAFVLTKTDISQRAGFIPGYKGLEPTLPQLAEIQSYNPVVIEGASPTSSIIRVQNAAGFPGGGNAIRDLMNAPDFDAALSDLNAKWASAAEREQ